MRLSVSRENYLGERLVAAETAAMMFGARPPAPLSDDLTNKILNAIDVKALTLSTPDGKVTLTRSDAPAKPDYIFDNTDPGLFEGIGAAVQALFAPTGSTLKVTGTGALSSQRLDITIDQTSLTARLWRLSRNFFILSLIISAALMAALWAALWVMVIRPVRRLTSSIIAFGADPQDTRRVIMPSRRHDDIGRAEAALAEMQSSLAHELSQRKRLAELGMAVARINHDLRNMLAAAQLMSDRLATISDPLAQRLAPQLVATLDRAIEFCQSTLAYGGARERADSPPLRPARSRAPDRRNRGSLGRVGNQLRHRHPAELRDLRRFRSRAPHFREFEPQRDAGFENRRRRTGRAPGGDAFRRDPRLGLRSAYRSE